MSAHFLLRLLHRLLVLVPDHDVHSVIRKGLRGGYEISTPLHNKPSPMPDAPPVMSAVLLSSCTCAYVSVWRNQQRYLLHAPIDDDNDDNNNGVCDGNDIVECCG